MFQNDYILQLIEMLGRFLQRLKQVLDEHERKSLMDKACREHCGLSLETLQLLSSETLIELLPDSSRLLASELLYHVSSFFDKEASQLKSLRLLLSLQTESELCRLRIQRVKELSESLAEFLNGKDYMDCAAFFLQGNAFSDCEDAIFRAVSLSDSMERKTCIKTGTAMLYKAAEADAAELAQCNLNREELFESVFDLQMMERQDI